MYYELSGHGDAILFLHAGIADCHMWDRQIVALSRHYKVIRCDLRGFGKTPRGTVRFSHYRDAAALLDSLGIQKVHLVGASFGGSVAVDFALAYPERVRSLVLCAPAVSGAPRSSEITTIDSVEEAFLRNGDRVGAAAFMVRTWVVGPFRRPEDVSGALQQQVAELQLQNYVMPESAGAENVPLEPRAFTRLEDIHAPTLVLAGDKDIPSFQSLATSIAGRIPHAMRMTIPNVAHLINMEKPEVFNRIVGDFLANQTGGQDVKERK